MNKEKEKKMWKFDCPIPTTTPVFFLELNCPRGPFPPPGVHVFCGLHTFFSPYKYDTLLATLQININKKWRLWSLSISSSSSAGVFFFWLFLRGETDTFIFDNGCFQSIRYCSCDCDVICHCFSSRFWGRTSTSPSPIHGQGSRLYSWKWDVWGCHLLLALVVYACSFEALINN